jgi:hypothetical protein
MTSTISVEARMIPKESMAKVFDAFVKMGEVRNIEIQSWEQSQEDPYNFATVKVHYEKIYDPEKQTKLNRGETCELFLKECIVEMSKIDEIDLRLENEIMRNTMEQTLSDVENCKEFIQLIQKTAPEQLDDRLSKIRRTIQKCLSTVKKMRKPCRGCIEGLLNQEGHYGGCIDEEVFKWYEEW